MINILEINTKITQLPKYLRGYYLYSCREKPWFSNVKIYCVFHWSTVFWNITSLWQRKIECLYPRISNYHSPGSPGVNNRQTILLFCLPQPELTCWQGETDLNRIKDRKNVNVSPLLSSSHFFAFCMGTKCGKIVLMVRIATHSFF